MAERHFNLLDVMVLIVAAAFGLAAARWWYGLPGYVNPSKIDVQSGSELIGWVLLPQTFALLILRLREPRPRWRRMVRQPGIQANLVVCLAAVTALLGGGWGYKPHWSSLPLRLGVEQANLVGPMLASGWTLTALVRCRRPEPGLIDRLGRALGWCWIVLWVGRNLLDEGSLVRWWLPFLNFHVRI